MQVTSLDGTRCATVASKVSEGNTFTSGQNVGDHDLRTARILLDSTAAGAS